MILGLGARGIILQWKKDVEVARSCIGLLNIDIIIENPYLISYINKE